MQDLKQPNNIDLNNDKVLNQIIKDYTYIIWIFIFKYKIYESDQLDVLQEGRIGILKAIKAYEEGKGTSFKSFVSLCIERQIITFLRQRTRRYAKIKDFKPLNEIMGLQDTVEKPQTIGVYRNEVEDEVFTKIYYKNAYKEATKGLRMEEINVFKAYVYGYSINELCSYYSLNKKQVYFIISKIKKRIEEKLNNH